LVAQRLGDEIGDLNGTRLLEVRVVFAEEVADGARFESGRGVGAG
jgi:hypothetical protein